MRTLMNDNNNNDWKKRKEKGGGALCTSKLVMNDKFMKISVCQVSYWRRPFLFLADITIFNETIFIIIPNIVIFHVIWKTTEWMSI